MHKASRPLGFTLIELLTVIAIIAILAAILFPLAGTVREQARASDCMSKLHQIWVSASVYKQDENGYPPELLGVVERPDHQFATTGDTWIRLDDVYNSYLYKEQIKDVGVFRCPDNTPEPSKLAVTYAHYPPKPANWPANTTYVGDTLAESGCPTDAYGTIDCFTDGVNAGKPKFFYVWDSYDIGPRTDMVNGGIVRDGDGNIVYDRHYSRDWTGVRGLTDMTNQLKYTSPPDDKTLLTYCTWHTGINGSPTAPAISLAGTAKKIDIRLLVLYGANVYNR